MVCRYLRKFLHESLAPKKQGLGVQNPCPLSLSGHDVAIAEGMHGDRAEVCPLDASAIICLSTVFLIHFCPEFILFSRASLDCLTIGSSVVIFLTTGANKITETIIARDYLTAGCSGFISIGGRITVNVEFPFKPLL